MLSRARVQVSIVGGQWRRWQSLDSRSSQNINIKSIVRANARPEDQDKLTSESVFHQFLQATQQETAGQECTGTIQLQSVDNSRGRGLIALRKIKKGETLLNLPLDLCLVVDYDKGVVLPSGEWVRVRRGLQKDDTLQWDVIQALALLDSMSGMGSKELELYTNHILPEPKEVSLPLCFPEHLLLELQDSDMMCKAQEQQKRLYELFPGLGSPMVEDGPTWLQYAFACVRSRAFKIGKEAYAFLPILDTANHSPEPNADFVVFKDTSCVRFFALEDIEVGQEVCISYSGKVGYTNRRMMTQYGFVDSKGNPFDRYPIDNERISSEINLSLDAIQDALGNSDRMVEVLSGKDPYMYACLKSLPVGHDDRGAAAPSSVEDQLELAARLLNQVKDTILSWQTDLRDDESLLAHMEASSTSDKRLKAALQYRIENKKLTLAMRNLLQCLHDYLI